ncbi:hypothetical protein CC86DRAFT_413282 [Ophiobolus disseminans]|uniref:Uncharacterized protein n=1 Tax=Ophiobolus disseminans TaxID=1469910 RepID=A0A6A6ZDL8_9PLEO|nr:hypothetical protein CC86DRAFT_413282 [Ophiobolus disseminans]
MSSLTEQSIEMPLLERLKKEMKKHAPLLEYIPLDDIEMTTQTDVPNTISQTCELGTVPGRNGSQLTLVACMVLKSITTATDGGIPRVLLYGHGPDGLSRRQQFTAREVSRLNSLNATFAPANANPDTLNALLKYIFLAKGAPIPAPAEVKFLFGFTRALGQVCRAYKERAAKTKAVSAREDTPMVDGSMLLPQTVPELLANSLPQDNDDVDLDEISLGEDPSTSNAQTGSAHMTSSQIPPGEDTQAPSTPSATAGSVKMALSVTGSFHAEDDSDASIASVKRTLTKYQELRRGEKVIQSDLEATDGAKVLMQMAHKASQERLETEQEAERKALEAKQATELGQLEESQRPENDEMGRRHAAQIREKEKVDQAIKQTQENTPRERVWAIIDYLDEERPAKRQKVACGDEDRMEE